MTSAAHVIRPLTLHSILCCSTMLRHGICQEHDFITNMKLWQDTSGNKTRFHMQILTQHVMTAGEERIGLWPTHQEGTSTCAAFGRIEGLLWAVYGYLAHDSQVQVRVPHDDIMHHVLGTCLAARWCHDDSACTI